MKFIVFDGAEKNWNIMGGIKSEEKK